MEIPNQLKIEAEFIINKIKNLYETMRYISGLILGLFDIINDNLECNLSWYFSQNRSVTNYYYPPKNRYKQRLWLKDYLNINEYKKFFSIKYFFEEWLFKKIKPIRIHDAHRERDVVQDELENGKYIIENRRLSLYDLKDLLKDLYLILYLIIILVAKFYFQDSEKYLKYIFKSLF